MIIFPYSCKQTLHLQTRRGGWRYLDTGQVLIESACSVDRAEEALSTLLPMLPEIQYYRFNPGSISVMFSLLFFSFCCYRGTSCHPQINSIPLDLNIDFLLPLQEANQLGHPLGICSVLFFLWASYVKDYLFYLTLTGYWPVVIWYSFIPVLRLFIWKDIPKDCHFMKESWLSLSIPHDLPTVDERCEMELDETDRSIINFP